MGEQEFPFNPQFLHSVLTCLVVTPLTVLCCGCGTAMVVQINSGHSRMGSWSTCPSHPSVLISSAVTQPTETGWVSGIASMDRSRSSGAGTLSGAQSTWQAAQHLMQQSAPKLV